MDSHRRPVGPYIVALCGLLYLFSPLVAWLALRDELVVAFDEAFALTRPELVAELSAFALAGPRIAYLQLSLEKGPSTLVDFLRTRKKPARALVVSPLIARALMEGAKLNGSTPPGPLLVIEGSDPAAFTLVSDPLPAFRLAGRLLGSILDDYRRGSAWSGTPAEAASGALFLAIGSGQAQRLSEAFSAGWAEASTFLPDIEELPAEGADEGGQAALRKALSGDLKAVVVAAGAATPGMVDIAIAPGRITGLASPSARGAARAWREASFVLHPDEAGMAAAIRSFSPAKAARTGTIPWRLELLPGAAELASRNIDLAERLETAERHK